MSTYSLHSVTIQYNTLKPYSALPLLTSIAYKTLLVLSTTNGTDFNVLGHLEM